MYILTLIFKLIIIDQLEDNMIYPIFVSEEAGFHKKIELVEDSGFHSL